MIDETEEVSSNIQAPIIFLVGGEVGIMTPLQGFGFEGVGPSPAGWAKEWRTFSPGFSESIRPNRTMGANFKIQASIVFGGGGEVGIMTPLQGFGFEGVEPSPAGWAKEWRTFSPGFSGFNPT